MAIFTKKGITITRTDRYCGILMQGGVSGRKMFISWSDVTAITKLSAHEIEENWDKPDSWNDGMSIAEFVTEYVCAGHYTRLLSSGSEIH